jgi:hypothetical protein
VGEGSGVRGFRRQDDPVIGLYPRISETSVADFILRQQVGDPQVAEEALPRLVRIRGDGHHRALRQIPHLRLEELAQLLDVAAAETPPRRLRPRIVVDDPAAAVDLQRRRQGGPAQEDRRQEQERLASHR